MQLQNIIIIEETEFQGSSTQGPCSPKVCTEASTSFKTNEECAEYQSGCIALENGGCILAGECSTLLSQYQCSGKKSCQWNPQCVKNTVCSDLSSEILCKTVKLQNDKTCWWVSQSCVNRECTQASITYDSDSLCDSFLTGCLTNKKGCVSSTTPCTSYQGSKATCESFTIKCTNIDAANESTNCQDKPCSSNTTATTDSECDSYHKGCLTKGTGCIDSTAPCSSYDGTSIEICSKFIGNKMKCWWTNGKSKCEDKLCTHADSTNITDSQCEQFLSGCVTTLSGCIAKDSSCDKYTGTQAICGALTKGCSLIGKCIAEKTCSEITGATSQQSCDDILPGVCMFVKDKCMKKSSLCSDYKHDTADLSVNDCKNLQITTFGMYCYWATGKACADRDCSQITGSGITLSNCQSHIFRCAAKADGTGCENYNCANAPNKTDEAGCQAYHPYCHFDSQNVDKCIYTGSCSVFQKGNCSTKIANSKYNCAEPASPTSTQCENLTSCTGQPDCASVNIINQGYCFLYGSTCESRDCAKAQVHLGVSLTSPTQCINYDIRCVLTYEGGIGKCTVGYQGYNPEQNGCTIVQGTAEQCKTLQGRAIVGSAITNIKCAPHDQGNKIAPCFNRTCADIKGLTNAICQEYLSTCKTDGTKCVDISTPCTNFSSTPEGCSNFAGLTIGSKCQSNITSSSCTDRPCSQNSIATTDADCDTYQKGCITNGKGCTAGTTPCSSQYGNNDECKILTGNGKKCWQTSANKDLCVDRLCSHNTSSTTDNDCDKFLKDCVTKGTGCIEKTAECSSYQGSQTDCERFIGNGKSCTNDTTATATTSCKVKDCSKLISDSYTENICHIYGQHCHYNGTKCDVISTCASLKGNFVTCATYVASDGPCKGTSLQTEAPTNCQAATCSDAPITLTTNIDCDLYKKGCVTNGRGCASSVTCSDISIESSCLSVKSDDKNICTWASQCRDMQQTCSSYTAYGQSVCLNTNISQGFGLCVWKNSTCSESTCEDLPLTITSEDDCNAYSITCTFAGIGKSCVTKSYCKSYTTQDVCINAKSKDLVGQCSWDENFSIGTLIVGCRAKNCQDAPTTITTNEECEAFIAGCKTNGAGCQTSPLECKDFKTQQKCIQDTALKPCLWYNNSCIQYYKCEDIPQKTILACQAISKYCTSDSTKCVPMQTCSAYSKQFSCSIGTDGLCGWETATKKCKLFTQCTDIVSKINSECVTYNSKCISNGTNCIEQGECTTYADSEYACKLGGTDGSCFYDKDITTCRLRQCSDATASTNTHNGCYGYQINSKTKCTTDGTKCIPLADCSTYQQSGCVIDAKFEPQDLCSIKKTKSSECASALSGCVSNGTNCIILAKCAEYTFKESCNAGGTDGSCVFSPSLTSATTGTCKVFSQCSDANFDQIACQSKSAACKWTPAQGTNSSSCQVHTCDTAAKGTSKCVTVPNFDASSYQVCVLSGGKCIQGDPSTLVQETCYKMSQYTYTWNTDAKKCQACIIQNSTQNNNTVNNTINDTENATQDSLFYSFFVVLLMTII